MATSPYATTALQTKKMPPGIPYIIGNEAAERFSFYGMRTILTIFMVKYLWLMGDQPGEPMTDAEASEQYHLFTGFVYLTPFLGALLADFLFGKYRVIIWLSLVYCLGHGSLALMGIVGKVEACFAIGLWLIIFGSGGIKPCVSAHVGDQFGPGNQHLLTRIFNWFYFSINLGAFASSLLTPWLLEWYGPHVAFGVPGVLMLIATICFWAGRHKFVHIPAERSLLIRDIGSREGIFAMLKLCVIYFFVAVFWALFDQTGSSWVLQAEDMDRRFLGVEWLPSQIQALNPILILIFIPLFTYFIYPAINKVFRLSPLRKISIGLYVMVFAFAVIAIAQESIDAGGRPSISWQLLGYVIITAAEVMVSIVCLEFSYTQAPRSLKSFVMALFFISVFVGNFFTAKVNDLIQVDNPVAVDWRKESVDERTFPGFDGKEGTGDDVVVTREGEIRFAGRSELEKVVKAFTEAIRSNGFDCPNREEGNLLIEPFQDSRGNYYRYSLINRRQCRITGSGVDGEFMTPWDEGVILKVTGADGEPSGRGLVSRVLSTIRPDVPWLERRKSELGVATESETAAGGAKVTPTYFIGGQAKLEGAPYFWFFTQVMMGAALFFTFVAIVYQPRAYLYEGDGEK